MTQAGWYPDPAGQPQTYRYWDGSTWSEQTTGDPYGPPPVPPGYGAVPPPPPPPPPPPSYGGSYPAAGPGPGSAGSAGAGGSGGSGKVALLVGAAVVALLLVGIGGFLGIRALSDDGDDTASESSSEPTPEPTAPGSTDGSVPTAPTAPSAPTDPGSTGPTQQQCLGGDPAPSTTPRDGATHVTGGGLSIPVPDGYEPDTSYASAFTFADDFTPVQKLIEQTEHSGWVSIYGVGALRKANGFTDPAAAAEAVMACMAASPDLYQDFTGRDDLGSGELTIDGADAFQVSAELRVDDPELSVEGDVAQVVVVDTGDAETFGLFVTVVPIGADALIAQQAAFPDQIEVR